MRATATTLCLLLTALPACGGDDPLDGERDGFPTGKGDGAIDEGSPEALAVLALVDDPTVDVAELDDDAGLNATAARRIIAHRDGADHTAATADDDPFGSLAELDAVPFVGPLALAQLLAYARAQGRLAPQELSVIFSPQPKDASHTARIAQLIGRAQHSLDIAMYSFSDAAVRDALAAAVARGVKVRFVFDGATSDKQLTGDALATSASGRLEAAGIDVRYVNQIMHHKFMIMDGPRDDVSRATTATLVSGSANWSNGGATIFDENTLFMVGHPELAISFQREFDLLWNHSRDLVAGPAKPFERSTADLDHAGVPDDPTEQLFTTSANFAVADGSSTFRVDKHSFKLADEMVAAIGRAQKSIHIASGHLRLRPVAEALIAKHLAHPEVDIRVYLDEQEYLSAAGAAAQDAAETACLAKATSDDQRFDCANKEQLFGKRVGDAGVAVRYKLYAYRWDFSYAVQMHHKFMVIDGRELYTGSYNLSINAEQATFDNSLHLSGPQHAALVSAFEQNFETIWATGRAPDLLGALRTKVAADPTIPLVFDSMALTWQEVTDLKTLLRANCAAADSTEFRTHPAAHKLCPR